MSISPFPRERHRRNAELLAAVFAGRHRLVAELIDQKADPNSVDVRWRARCGAVWCGCHIRGEVSSAAHCTCGRPEALLRGRADAKDPTATPDFNCMSFQNTMFFSKCGTEPVLGCVAFRGKSMEAKAPSNLERKQHGLEEVPYRTVLKMLVSRRA